MEASENIYETSRDWASIREAEPTLRLSLIQVPTVTEQAQQILRANFHSHGQPSGGKGGTAEKLLVPGVEEEGKGGSHKASGSVGAGGRD